MRQGGPGPAGGYGRRQGEWAGDDWGDDWPVEEEAAAKPLRKRLWLVAATAAVLLATGGGFAAGQASLPRSAAWLAAPQLAVAGPLLDDLGGSAPMPDPSVLAGRLAGLLGDSRLARVTVSITDVASGEELFARDGDADAVPASTAKLITGAAVLHARGPTYRISTRVVAGSQPGEVVLIGGGDPTLAAGATGSYAGAARLDTLAAQVTKALGGTAPTKVVIDTSLYQGAAVLPEGVWYGVDLRAGVMSRITPLMIDGARQNPKQTHGNAARHADPALTAGRAFAKALGLPASAVRSGTAPGGAETLGEVFSPPVSRLVETMLLESDNVLAEGLARQVALAKGQPASFAGAAAATQQVLADLGISMNGLGLVDGSGLSAFNRVSASLLTAVLAKAASGDAPELRALLSGLPVAGYSGTLNDRFTRSNTGAAAAGVVRAKTGTLTGVNALAGIAVDADGRLLAFALLANQTTSSGGAEVGLDRVAAAIAACGCS